MVVVVVDARFFGALLFVPRLRLYEAHLVMWPRVELRLDVSFE